MFPKLQAARTSGEDRTVLHIGDSTTRGKAAGLRAPVSTLGEWGCSFPICMGQALAAAGWAVDMDCWFGASAYRVADLCLADPRLQIADSWDVDTQPCLGGRPLASRTCSDGAISFTPGGRFDVVDIFVIGTPSSGQLTLLIDGQIWQEGVSTQTAGKMPQRLTFKLPSLARTVSVRHTGGSTVMVFGMICRDSAIPRLHMANAGWSGSRTVQWLLDDRAAPWRAIHLLQPVLTIINLGINDWTKDTPLREFESNLTKLVEECRHSGDVMLTLPVESNPSAVRLTQQTPYVDLLRSLGEKLALPVIDFRTLIGPWSQARAAGLMQDNKHPSSAGHHRMGQALAAMLLNNSLQVSTL